MMEPEIFDALGYSTYPSFSLPSTANLANIQKTLDKLASIDAQLEQSVQDSMALSVGTLKVDFNRNIQSLKTEGSRLLGLLQAQTGCLVYYDRYYARYAGQVKNNPLTITSYW